jgi:membrane-associated phospholipid phosphatase
MIIGSKYDLSIDILIFNPQNKFSIGMEAFGQFVYWGMWGPLFTVLFLTRHDLNESLEIIGRIFPFVKPVSNTKSNAYKFFNFILKTITAIAFFVLAVVGWKKLIENVLKTFFDLSQLFYFIICIVVAIIAIAVFSTIDKKTLYKLEALALAGVVFGIVLKVVENCKSITNRVRFREMVAYSNGFFDKDNLSYGKLDKLSTRLDKSMVSSTDFGAFTPWYKKGNDMGIYSHSNSFPSGHTTYSCALFMSVLLCNTFDRLKKAVPFVFCVSVVYVGLMGYSRLIAGAHYLTDVVGGAIIGYTLFLFVSMIYKVFNDKGILQ